MASAGSGQETEPGPRRAEIDTSPPFESVKEAANLFGGMAFWKPFSQKPSPYASQHDDEMVTIVKAGEQAAQLKRDLIAKERETFHVLKELESAKNIVEELKLKLQKEPSEINMALTANSPKANADRVAEEPEGGNNETDTTIYHNAANGVDQICPSSAPGVILLELKQAKLNLTRTTSDLAGIQSTVDLYNKKIEIERLSFEKTRQRLSSNASKMSSLEQELNQIKHKTELVKGNEVEDNFHNPLYFTRELQKLSSETEQFKKVGETAKLEVLRAMSEIKQTKTKIRIAEIRLVAAKKMKEAARASEVLALAEIKALSNGKKDSRKKSEDVILTFEEYCSLVSKAREAEEACKGRVAGAEVEIGEANMSKTEILKKVEEATEEVKISKKALEEALSRVEAANKGKLEVEEAMRKWRSEHGQKRRSVHNSTNFKNSHPSIHRKEHRLLDTNGVNSDNELKPVPKHTMSIGQILSRKLLLTEDYKNGMQVEKQNVSLAQMLSKPKAAAAAAADPHSVKKSGKENSEPPPAKRKKFGFSRISHLVSKQSKKKKQRVSSMCRNT